MINLCHHLFFFSYHHHFLCTSIRLPLTLTLCLFPPFICFYLPIFCHVLPFFFFSKVLPFYFIINKGAHATLEVWFWVWNCRSAEASTCGDPLKHMQLTVWGFHYLPSFSFPQPFPLSPSLHHRASTTLQSREGSWKCGSVYVYTCQCAIMSVFLVKAVKARLRWDTEWFSSALSFEHHNAQTTIFVHKHLCVCLGG